MRIAARIIGTLALLLIIILVAVSNFNAASIVILVFGFLLYFWEFMPKNRLFKCVKILTVSGILFFALGMGFIFVSGNSTSNCSEDAVVVLGCALHGYTPSKTLVARLDACVEYAQKNSEALIIVSGGQGMQESIPEAQAMYDYLIANGIEKNNIIIEDKATSTNENFIYSKEILDNRFGADNYTLCFITNHFHTYRAGKLAELNGINAYSYSAKTPNGSLFVSYVREVLAVVKLWVFRA